MNCQLAVGKRALIAVCCLLSAVNAAAAPDCLPLKQPEKTASLVQDQRIAQPGRYCLQEDLFVRGYKSLAEGGRVRTISPIVVNIAISNVSIDLNGREIWSDGRLDAGVETKMSPNADYENALPVANPPINLIVRNGKMKLERDGIGVRFSGLGGIPYDRFPEVIVSDAGASRLSDEPGAMQGGKNLPSDREWRISQHEQVMALLPKGPSAYLQRNVLIEKMTITTQQAAIVIQGAGTVIRDNVIDVSAGTAIWIYGPGAVIENNTIIVHGRGLGKDPLLEADAPIRLIHGDGAIIRNNRIVAAADAHHRAISLFNTGAIKVEGNRFEGMTANDDWAKAFLGTARVEAKDNKFGSVGVLTAAKALFR